MSVSAARPKRPRGKYNAVRTEYRGVVYASKLEAAHARGLDERLRRGEIGGWRKCVEPWLLVDGPLRGDRIDWLIDFEVWGDRTGAVPFVRGATGLWVEETKGVRLPDFELKQRLFRRVYPTVPLRLVTARGATWL